LADWVNQFDWQIWFTGTFKPDKSYRDTIKAKRAYERWIRTINKQYGLYNIEYFLAVERFKFGDFIHCHSLINGLGGLTYRMIGESWRALYGREKVEGYEKDKGANFYLTKYVTKDLCDWDLHIDKRKSHILDFRGE
jgi:hypothetical protein